MSMTDAERGMYLAARRIYMTIHYSRAVVDALDNDTSVYRLLLEMAAFDDLIEGSTDEAEYKMQEVIWRRLVLEEARQQKMLLVRDGNPVKTYPVSTSKFGVGDRPAMARQRGGAGRRQIRMARRGPPVGNCLIPHAVRA